MSDPIRWLDDADASAQERALLSSARNMNPPPGAQEKVWGALQIHLGPGVGSGGSSSGNAVTNGSSGAGSSGAGSAGAGSSGASISTAVGGIKGVVAGVASIATIAGTVAAIVTTSPTTPPKIDIPKPQVVEELRAPHTDAPEETEEKPLLDEVIPSPSSAPIPPDMQSDQTLSPRVSNAKPAVMDKAPAEEAVRARQERASRLREESRSLGDARAALRRGDAASALEKLDALGGQFPEGVLDQEREVLAIEALARAGKRAAASERAAAFLQEHPTSPHAKKVRGFLQ